MPEKHYSGDWAKSKSREMHKDMLESLVKARKPKNIKCLIFPGIDGAEINEIIDPLDIPLQNITGIEREKDIADKIKEKFPAMDVQNDNFETYVKGNKTFDFDDVSIDFTGPINWEIVEAIGKICKNQERDRFILHCANSIRRDRTSNPTYLTAYSFSQSKGDIFDLKSFNKDGCTESINNCYKAMDEIMGKVKNGESIKGEKGIAHSWALKIALGGSTTSSLCRMFRYAVGDDYKQMMDSVNKELKKALGEDFELDLDNPSERLLSFPPFVKFLDNSGIMSFKSECIRNGIRDMDHISILYSMVHEANYKVKNFSVRKAKKYSYISESGCPMIGEILELVHPRHSLEYSKEAARLVGYPHKFEIKNGRLNEVLSLCREWNSRTLKYISDEESREVENAKRIYIGSSSKPVLSKKRAIEEFRNGNDIDFIKKKYRGWEKKSLSQWKAHFTMDTYDKTLKEDDPYIEKIGKEDAIELLKSNIPPSEIYDVFPTSFSLQSLRGIKAAVTKGQY